MGEPGVVEVARDDDVGPVPLAHRGARVKRLQTDCLKCIFNQTASNAGFFFKEKASFPITANHTSLQKNSFLKILSDILKSYR